MSAKRMLLIVTLVAVTIAAALFVFSAPDGMLGFQARTSPTAGDGDGEEAPSAIVLINEVMPSNSGIVADEAGASSDWFELYNPGDGAVNLSGFTLTDNPSKGAKYVFGNVKIEAGGYLLVFASGRNVTDSSAPYLHVPFKLKGDESLLITDASGSTIDAVTVPAMPQNVSVGRAAGDADNWAEFDEPTPGFSNDAAGRQAYLDSLKAGIEGLYINELMASNQTTILDEYGEYSDWVELYNATSSPADLSGYGLTDRVDDLMRYKFPEGTLIEPGGYLVVFCSGRRDPLGDSTNPHAPFRLSSYSEALILTGPNGKIVDRVDYQELAADNSYARNAQDIGLWEYSAKPTPGYPNTDDGYAQFGERSAAVGELYISEVMHGNPEVLDTGAESYDWLEIHNASSEAVDLSRYGLSDNTKNPVKWRFPEGVTLEGDQRMIVALSGRDVKEADESKKKYFETNFALGTDGEILTLSDPEGKLVDRLNPGHIPYGVSFGRTGGQPLYYETPTPGEENGGGQEGVTAPPSFTTPPGVYDGPVQVSLSAREGETIYYTTDCNAPTAASGRYTGPISVDENTVIRAVAVRDGYVTGPVASGAFLLKTDGVNHALPIVNLITDPANLWDSKTGIYAYGDSFDPEEPFPRSSANYYQGKTSEAEQEKWERMANFSLFGDDSKVAFSQDVDIRIAGSFGRGNAQKGFNMIARKEYGNSRMEYPFFDTRDFTEYKALVLRAGGQDQRMSKLRDELATGLLDGTDVNVLHQAYKPVVLYLNGEYWGVYFLKEKRNRFFVEQHEGLPGDGNIPLDLIKSASQVYYGSSDAWKELMEYIKGNALSKQSAYERVAAEVDVNSFMDYMIAEIYSANSDVWNIQYYRMPGGKWKWIYYDFCWSFGNTENGPEHKTLAIRRLDSKPCSDLFNALLKNEGWRDAFIRRFAQLLETVYSQERVNAKIDELVAVLEPEIVREREKFNAETFMGEKNAAETRASADVGKWLEQVERVRNFVSKRHDSLKAQIKAEFGLSDSYMAEVFG